MKLAFIFILLTLSSLTHAYDIRSKSIHVKAARITDRVVLVEKDGGALTVQVIQEFLCGSTDVSNTSRIILSISQLGEMSDTTASFELAQSMSFKSAKRISGGIYQITYSDANAESGNGFEVTKTINAIKAIKDVQKGCAEFESCERETTVDFE